VAGRVRDFLTQLDRSVPGQRALLVAHDAVVVTLRYVIAGIGTPVPDGVTPVPNASVSQWHGDGQHLRLASWGSITHLNIKETAV
jgi:broad specificity phosphatase PhoE